MTLKDSVQTAIFVVGIFTILVFGASYYFVLADTKPTDQPLKDALAITASFFGGFATLTAAYVASRLFNDWREQKKYDIISQLTMDASLDLIRAKDKFHFYLFQYVYGLDEVTFKEVDDIIFHAINKLDLLNQILVRFKMPDIGSEITEMYKVNYCNLPEKIRNLSILKQMSEEQIKEFSNKSFDGYEKLNEKMLNNLNL